MITTITQCRNDAEDEIDDDNHKNDNTDNYKNKNDHEPAKDNDNDDNKDEKDKTMTSSMNINIVFPHSTILWKTCSNMPTYSPYQYLCTQTTTLAIITSLNKTTHHTQQHTHTNKQNNAFCHCNVYIHEHIYTHCKSAINTRHTKLSQSQEINDKEYIYIQMQM